MRGAALAWMLVLASCGKKTAATIAADPAPSAKSAPALVMADSTERITATKASRLVASGQAHPWSIFVDERWVWWSNKGKGTGDGAILRVPKAGGPIEPICTDLDAPYGIAVGEERLAFGVSRPGKGGYGVWKLSELSAGTCGHLALKDHEPWALVITGGFLYFSDLRAHAIERVALEDAARTTVATTKGRPVGLAVDATHAFFTDSDPGVVAKAPLAGGPVVELYKGGDKTTGIAIDATDVYWSEWGSGRIAKVSKNGGTVTVLATDQKGARAIAIDGQRVFFTHPPSGSIRSVAKSGGPVTIHATGQKHPYSVAVDGKSIFWANVDGGTVEAVDK